MVVDVLVPTSVHVFTVSLETTVRKITAQDHVLQKWKTINVLANWKKYIARKHFAVTLLVVHGVVRVKSVPSEQNHVDEVLCRHLARTLTNVKRLLMFVKIASAKILMDPTSVLLLMDFIMIKTKMSASMWTNAKTVHVGTENVSIRTVVTNASAPMATKMLPARTANKLVFTMALVFVMNTFPMLNVLMLSMKKSLDLTVAVSGVPVPPDNVSRRAHQM